MKNEESFRREWQVNEERFSNAGFSFEIFKELLEANCLLFMWDMFCLFCYAKAISDGGSYLEIGSMCGGSLLCAYRGIVISGNRVKLHAIDWVLDETIEEKRYVEILRIFNENTKNIKSLIRVPMKWEDAAEEIADNSMDLIFNDADQDSDLIKETLRLYWPKLKVGGMFLGHDSHFSGVLEVLGNLFGNEVIDFRNRIPKDTNSQMWGVRKSEKNVKLPERKNA